MAELDQPDAGAEPVRSGRGQRRAAGAGTPAKGGSGGRTGPIQFIRECREELRRVQWPDQDALVQATTVVLVVSIVVGTYLWGLDQVLSRAASWLIRQQAG